MSFAEYIFFAICLALPFITYKIGKTEGRLGK